MRYTFHSLRERFLLLVLVALMPVLIAVVYTAAGQRQQGEMEAERSTLNLVRLAIREQERLIGETQQLLMALSHLPAVRAQAAPDECNRLLAELRRSYAYYTNLGVASMQGDIYCSAVPLPGPVNVADRAYFRRTVSSGGLGIGEYQVGRVTGVHALNLGYPVLEDGALRAVVYAALDLSWLSDMIDRLDLPARSTLTVIDSGGTVLSRYPDPERWVGRSMAESDMVAAILRRHSEGTQEFTGLDGVSRLYAFAPLHAGASGTVYVAVGVPKAEAYAAANRTLSRGVAVLLLVALLVAAAVWFGSEVFIVQPVRALARAVRSLAAGDLSARSGLPRGRDELACLAQDFDAMASALQRVTRALETLSRGNRTLTRAEDEQELLWQMCKTIVDVGGYAAAWVGYLDGPEALRPVAYAGIEAGSAPVIGVAELPEDHPLAQCLQSGRNARLRGADPGDPRLRPWPGCRTRQAHAAATVFPLHVHGRVLGVLAIYSRDADAFEDSEADLLDETAGDLAYGIAALRTRVENRRAQETILEMASRDRLTGLPNHLALEERLRRHMLEEGAAARPLALLFLDLHRFREINTALGFSQGDLLLQEASGRLRRVVGEAGLVARMRGDEFAMLLPADEGCAAARRVLAALDEPFLSRDLTLTLAASIGIAFYPEHGREPEHLIRHADVAMRQAKAADCRIAVYAASQEDGARRLAMASELKRAIEHGELTLHYQPKLDMRSNRLIGAEALVRWVHPRQGTIAPAEFIPLAEHTGLIRPLTEYVVSSALREIRRWSEGGLELSAAVNLSARNLQDAELLRKIEIMLAENRVAADRLELELTESAIMEDPKGALAVLQRLREAGLRLYVDDFGTGYSSLAYLQKLPVDAVKIDRSFVTGMLDDEDLEKIVRSTIDLAHDLDLKVVAEGVESAEVWDRLLAMGCDTAQGYFISRPLPPADFERWARRHRAAQAPADGVRRASGRGG